MSVVGLFAGIGGLELGLAGAGFHASLLCDVLPAARAVLAGRFDTVPYHHDITTLRSLPSETRVLCAGFPCQDLSQAGKTAGLDGERSGLIGEVFRLLRRKRVESVVVENVPFMLQLNGGQAMRAIVQQFEALGYRWAYRVVDSWSFGLPQRRERVILVASREVDPMHVLFADDSPRTRPATDLSNHAHGFYWTEGLGGLGWAVDAVPTLKNGSTIGIPSPPAVLMADGRIVKPTIEDAERLQGFEPGWTSPAELVGRSSARWGLVGSAVSVPVARWVGTRLVDPGKNLQGRLVEFPLSGRLPKSAAFDGRRRVGVAISTDPVAARSPHLSDFLEQGRERPLLSLKATLGFLGRTRRAKLRFVPGFIDAVELHATRMACGSEFRLPERPVNPQLELLEAV